MSICFLWRWCFDFCAVREDPPVQFIQIVYYIFCAFCFALALSFLTSAIVPFFRDFGQIVNIVLQVWMWACPIMWDLNQMLGGYPLLMRLIKLNPFVYVVEGYRDCYINGVWFWERGLYNAVFLGCHPGAGLGWISGIQKNCGYIFQMCCKKAPQEI